MQLSKDRGPIGIAEVEAIGDGQRAGAGTGDVARRFRDRRPCAVVGIERDVPGVAIRRQRQPFVRTGHTEQGRVKPGSDHGVVLHLMVVGPIDRPAAFEVGTGQQIEQDGLRLGDRRHRRGGVFVGKLDGG